MLRMEFLIIITGPRNGRNTSCDRMAGGRYATTTMGITRAVVKTLVYCWASLKLLAKMDTAIRRAFPVRLRSNAKTAIVNTFKELRVTLSTA